jgi:hypothetical protein
LRQLWPGHYAGLEPLDKGRPEWKVRYATVFELSATNYFRKPNEIDSVTQEGVGLGTT